ncbi:MAG: amidohydrolase family protein, partial [Proteobacteria bacterium]|nr:amidohydrolase family protein [Pseudomonadota bacterium]
YKSGGLRHRIEHSQILRVEDIPRFKKTGVIASIQPTHATSDKNMAGNRLGEKRLAGAYVWKSLRDSGATMAGGSDFPVEPPNPFYGLHAAVTRQSRDNQPLGGWMKEQKLSREDSLSLFTEDAAYSAHQEDYIGRLLPGYYADFILVQDNYFTVPEQDIWKNKVIATFVAGREVFRAEEE